MRHFLNLVENEVERARDQHRPINSVHEGYAVILEELDEFWDCVRTPWHSEQAKQDMLCELVQVAAMAMRTAEDCGLLSDGDRRETEPTRT